MGLKSEASQPLNTRKFINVIILGPRKIKESQDQASSTVYIFIIIPFLICQHTHNTHWDINLVPFL